MFIDILFLLHLIYRPLTQPDGTLHLLEVQAMLSALIRDHDFSVRGVHGFERSFPVLPRLRRRRNRNGVRSLDTDRLVEGLLKVPDCPQVRLLTRAAKLQGVSTADRVPDIEQRSEDLVRLAAVFDSDLAAIRGVQSDSNDITAAEILEIPKQVPKRLDDRRDLGDQLLFEIILYDTKFQNSGPLAGR
jgi:hypothetical protein